MNDSKKLFRPKYCLVPLAARTNPNIPAKAQIYLGELNILTNEYGYCWASDEQLAEMQGVSTRTILEWHKILEQEGFIKRDTYRKHEINDETKKLEIKTERKIYVIDNPSNNFSDMKETSPPSDVKKTSGHSDLKKTSGITIEPLTKEKTHKKEAAKAACASSSQENDLKTKKDALESTGLLSDSDVMMFMRFELQSILKACELIKQESNVDSPVKWLKACIREKWWENGRIGKSTKIQKLESLKISTATAAKESGIKLNIVEAPNSLHIAGQNGGIEIRRNDLQETKDCIKIARLINKKFNLGNKVIFNELPNKGIFECL